MWINEKKDKKKKKAKKDKMATVMGEFKDGTLKSGGSGKKVTDRKQVIAIGLSESGQNKKSKKGGY